MQKQSTDVQPEILKDHIATLTERRKTAEAERLMFEGKMNRSDSEAIGLRQQLARYRKWNAEKNEVITATSSERDRLKAEKEQYRVSWNKSDSLLRIGRKRIQTLEALLQQEQFALAEEIPRANTAEAQLATAVRGLTRINHLPYDRMQAASRIARDTLKQIEQTPEKEEDAA